MQNIANVYAETIGADDFLNDERTPLQPGRENSESKRTITETKGWNVFRNPRLRMDSGSMTNHRFLETTLKIIKVLMYLVVFVVVLASSVVSKGAILLMTSQLHENRTVPYCNRFLDTEKTFVAVTSAEERIAWTWCIIFAFVIPEIGTLMRSVKTCFFGTWKTPRVDYFALVLTMETLHVFGLAVMFLWVLPGLDIVQGLMLTNCVSFVPGLLGLLSRDEKRDDAKRFILLAVDLAALAAQATAFVVWPLVDDAETSFYVLPLALVMVSCGWWENYVSVNSPLIWVSRLGRVKEKMKSSKDFIYIFVSVWKIASFLFTSIAIVQLKGNAGFDHLFTMFPGAFFREHNITVAEVPGSMVTDIPDALPAGVTTIVTTDVATPLYALGIQISSAYLAYVFSKFACKILMQRFSYALPIGLTVPVSISLLAVTCALRNRDPCLLHDTIPDYLFYEAPDLSVLSDFISQEYIWVWLLWLLSQAWITRHIWTPKCERLASTEKLFVAPMYSGLLIDQSLGMNRNRDDRSEIIVKDSTIIKVDESESDEESIYDRPINPPGHSPSTIKKNDLVTKIYVCATMWHETKDEMLDFLKSVLRLDQDQCARKSVQEYLKMVDPDYYELETHIFFDDAFDASDDDENEPQVNRFIERFVDVVKEAVSEVHDTRIRLGAPKKCSTPYGGRLVWTLPGSTKMTVHLKDAGKIRRRKRWSQVMYMYYLLGHRIMDLPISVDRKDVIAENTYLLTLDGDIDFRPSAVKLLVDLMKKNKTLGAACGRIHPVGSGPMVWYQMFEYAMIHWLQKATEHVIGCVVCSPGCFSLVRAKALMDDSVIKRYTRIPDEAKHYIQYDQGEDRWLCTLLLQRGYRIEYSAASDAYTHAPTNFKEFYHQRRRWIPSTMANVADLLMNYESTVKNNRNISHSYVFYQVLLMAGTILGPGTIFLILVGAFVDAFQISLWTSLIYNMIPVLTFGAVCFTCKSNTQLNVAAVISIVYGLAMMVVLISILIQMSQYSWLAPSSLFLFMVTGFLIIAGLMHPQELVCLPCGVIYYLTIPSIYMLLVIYSIANLDNLSWGTREVKAKKSPGESDEARGRKWLNGILRSGGNGKTSGPMESALALLSVNDRDQKSSGGDRHLDGILDSFGEVMKLLDVLERRPPEPQTPSSETRTGTGMDPIPAEEEESEAGSTISQSTGTSSNITCLQMTPYWFDHEKFKELEVDYISPKEDQFWKDLIEEYLLPINKDKTEKARIASELKSFRDLSAFAFFMLNSLFVLCIFLLELNQDALHIRWPFGVHIGISYDSNSREIHIAKTYLKLEPIGLVFFFFFIPILTIQFTGMLFHRVGTFAHILASTELNCCGKRDEISEESNLRSEEAVEIVKDLQRMDDEDDEYEDITRGVVKPARRETIRNLEMSRRRSNLVFSNLDDTFRARFFSISGGSGLPRKSSTRRASKALRAFEARRNTVMAEQRKKSQSEILLVRNGAKYEMAGSSLDIFANGGFDASLPDLVNFPLVTTPGYPPGRDSQFGINRQISVGETAQEEPSALHPSLEMEELRKISDTSSESVV